ncbi:MAG TPA: hypothetical protein VFQ88_02545 [Nevskiaceae bacterium]|nr:hypothetical protein [Nevskiaceae bacterium]
MTWRDLKGRAVLLDFFTPGCINCIHMVPVEDQLEQRFGTRLVILGIDAPKFTNSGTVSGLKDFLTVHQVRHPVVLDNHQLIWAAWHAVAWPTLVLVGPKGKALGRFLGEQTVGDLAAPIAAALADAPSASALLPLPLKPLAMTMTGLDAPGGIAVSGDRVAISDTGHNRVILATTGGRVVAVIGKGCAGGRDGDYATVEFARPHGLDFHDGKLYVADTAAQKVRVIDLKTHRVSTLAGNGEREYRPYGAYNAMKAPLNSPWDVQWVANKLYVSMAGDHDIWRYDPTTGKFGPWAGNGREGLRDGSLQDAEFAQPSGLYAKGGTLYDADPESSSIRAVATRDGSVQTLIGQGLFQFGLRNGPAAQALLQHAEGLVGLRDSLYIADTFNNAVRRLDLKTDVVSTVAKNLPHPQAIAALSPTQVLVTESGGDRVDRIDLSSGKVSPWPLKGLSAATCVRRGH